MAPRHDPCRAVAAAIFGDPSKVEFQIVAGGARFTSLANGESDLMVRAATNTLKRETQLGLDFTTVNFYDGQGFMVPKSLGMTKLADLSGATVCAEEGSTTLLYLADWFGEAKLPYKVENIADKTARLQAFFAGKCDAYASDMTALAADRRLAKTPDDYELLPEIISAEPLTLVTQPDASTPSPHDGRCRNRP